MICEPAKIREAGWGKGIKLAAAPKWNINSGNHALRPAGCRSRLRTTGTTLGDLAWLSHKWKKRQVSWRFSTHKNSTK
jgi:hypothetical protein